MILKPGKLVQDMVTGKIYVIVQGLNVSSDNMTFKEVNTDRTLCWHKKDFKRRMVVVKSDLARAMYGD